MTGPYTPKKIKTGIINPDTDDGEIIIWYMAGPDGLMVWFEVIKIAAEKIK